jgi:hypothetical protein
MTDIGGLVLRVASFSPVCDAMHMTERILPRGGPYVFVKTHPHLRYYLKLPDTRRAANQDWLRTAKVIKIRAASKSTQPDV